MSAELTAAGWEFLQGDWYWTLQALAPDEYRATVLHDGSVQLAELIEARWCPRAAFDTVADLLAWQREEQADEAELQQEYERKTGAP